MISQGSILFSLPRCIGVSTKIYSPAFFSECLATNHSRYWRDRLCGLLTGFTSSPVRDSHPLELYLPCGRCVHTRRTRLVYRMLRRCSVRSSVRSSLITYEFTFLLQSFKVHGQYLVYSVGGSSYVLNSKYFWSQVAGVT